MKRNFGISSAKPPISCNRRHRLGVLFFKKIGSKGRFHDIAAQNSSSLLSHDLGHAVGFERRARGRITVQLPSVARR